MCYVKCSDDSFLFLSRFAKKQDLRHLENVTLPRTGALEIILEELAPSFNERRALESGAAHLTNGQAAAGNGSAAAAAGEVKPREEDALNAVASSLAPGKKEISKVIDVTIAYPEARPLDLLAIATGYRRPCTTHVHYRVFDVKDVSGHIERSFVTFVWTVVCFSPRFLQILRRCDTGCTTCITRRTRCWPGSTRQASSRTTSTTRRRGNPRRLEGNPFFHQTLFSQILIPQVVHDPIRFLVLHLFFMGSSVALWKFSALARAAVAAAILI